MPVSRLRTVTFALPTTAPCGSVTVPWRVAVDCADARAPKARQKAAARSAFRRALLLFLSNMMRLSLVTGGQTEPVSKAVTLSVGGRGARPAKQPATLWLSRREGAPGVKKMWEGIRSDFLISNPGLAKERGNVGANCARPELPRKPRSLSGGCLQISVIHTKF